MENPLPAAEMADEPGQTGSDAVKAPPVPDSCDVPDPGAGPDGQDGPGEGPDAGAGPGEGLDAGAGPGEGLDAGAGPDGWRWRSSLGKELGKEGLIALVVSAVVVALGLPLGLLWRALAPSVELVKTQYGWYPVEEAPEGFIADDGWFTMIGLGAGLLVAAVVWQVVRNRRGPLMLLAVTLGSLGAAYVAQWIGHEIGLSAYQQHVEHASEGTRIMRQVGLYDDVAVFVQAAASAGLYTLLAAFHYAPSLRNDDFGDNPDEIGAASLAQSA